MTVTCETENCENQGIPIEIADTWTGTDGEQHQVTSVMCGACEQWIIKGGDD